MLVLEIHNDNETSKYEFCFYFAFDETPEAGSDTEQRKKNSVVHVVRLRHHLMTTSGYWILDFDTGLLGNAIVLDSSRQNAAVLCCENLIYCLAHHRLRIYQRIKQHLESEVLLCNVISW